MQDHIGVVIETPAASRTKHKWDEDARAYRAGHVLPLGMAFPFDLGFVPGTKAQDGDALVECHVLGGYQIEKESTR